MVIGLVNGHILFAIYPNIYPNMYPNMYPNIYPENFISFIGKLLATVSVSALTPCGL